jgi:hypothetical protein
LIIDAGVQFAVPFPKDGVLANIFRVRYQTTKILNTNPVLLPKTQQVLVAEAYPSLHLQALEDWGEWPSLESWGLGSL